MTGWDRFSKLPTTDTLKDYPTILDILKAVVAREEETQLHKLPLDRERNDYFYDGFRIGHYLLMQDRTQGLPSLLPTSRTPFTFYRGQSKYHEECLPSLYRYQGQELEKETLRSQLQTAEMILLMKSHPVIMSLESGGIRHEKLGPLRLPIMYDGLAQHYGIKTCYLDLTNDIWCAAFFAATTYDGEYHPYEVTKDMSFEKRFGVLYVLDYKNKGDTDFSKDHILPIGLQYFNRPGKQSALVIAMQDLKDLHKLPRLKRVFFRHDNEVSRLIFTLSQFGKQFITDDPFARMVEKICGEDVYSINAVMLAHRIYNQGVSFEYYIGMVNEQSFKVTGMPRVAYPKELCAKEYYEWKHGGADRYVDRIIIQAVAMMKVDNDN